MNPKDSDQQAFEESAWLDLSEALLGRLWGKIKIVLNAEERLACAEAELDHLCQEHAAFADLVREAGDRKRAFLEDLMSYGFIEDLLQDPTVEDITVNAIDPIFVHRSGQGLVRTDYRFATQRLVALFATKLVVFSGRPCMEAINNVDLTDARGRANVIESPFGPQITITRGKPEPLTILDLINSGMFSCEMGAQFWLYMEGFRIRPANILIAGSSGAGKTTLLNAILSFIPKRERLVTIEDTVELNTAFLENCSRLESSREMSMTDLVANSLRMRPERILVGEVRGEEAHDLMTGINLGKYCLGTLHASSARETVIRLQNEPMNIPPVLISLVDVFVIVRRFNEGGKVRRLVAEVAETAGMERGVVLLSTVWGYNPDDFEVIERAPSTSFRDRLALETGRTAMEIMEEVARRASVLEMMKDSGRFKTIRQTADFFDAYSEDPDKALGELEKYVRR